jgi:hypothetical protein
MRKIKEILIKRVRDKEEYSRGSERYRVNV